MATSTDRLCAVAAERPLLIDGFPNPVPSSVSDPATRWGTRHPVLPFFHRALFGSIKILETPMSSGSSSLSQTQRHTGLGLTVPPPPPPTMLLHFSQPSSHRAKVLSSSHHLDSHNVPRPNRVYGTSLASPNVKLLVVNRPFLPIHIYVLSDTTSS